MAARSEKTSHAGIIRIGFEGISQPHNAWSTPVSITRLKHYGRGVGKSRVHLLDGLMAGRIDEHLERAAPLAGRLSLAGEPGRPLRQQWCRRERRAWPAGPRPNRMRGTVRLSRAGPAGNHADVEADGAVDGLNHFKHRCRAATRRDAKAARLPAPRGDEPGARQGLQHLGEEAFRSARGLGQRGQRDAPIGRAARPTESSRGRHNRRRASVASTNWFSSSRCPARTDLSCARATPFAKRAAAR